MNTLSIHLTISLVFGFLFTSATSLTAQVVGRWKTIGDVDGKEKSIVEIYRNDGKIYGRVVELLPDARLTQCQNCQGELKNKPIKGMVILHDLTETSNGATGGKVLDPSSGKTYSCQLNLESPDKLKLRGYIGNPAFGKTQYWYRVQ